MRFAEKVGLAQLHADLPRLIQDAVNESDMGAVWRIQGPEYEEPRLATRHFEALQLAIKEQRLVQLSYAGPTAVGSAVVEPYRLLNKGGVLWVSTPNCDRTAAARSAMKPAMNSTSTCIEPSLSRRPGAAADDETMPEMSERHNPAL